jgi:hypothetical protein
VDLDQDGNVDILSGSWPGEIYLFRGDAERNFGKPEMLKDKSGEIINPGAAVEVNDGMLLITGYSEWKTDEETKEPYLLFRGKKYKETDGLSLASTGCAIHAHAADWDGDGDLDLILGDIGGNVYLIEDEGSAGKPAYGKHQPLKAGGKDLKVDGDAGPITVDWDGDGDLDLLVGGDSGAVTLFENEGSKTEGKLGEGREIVPPGSMDYGAAPLEATRGGRSKVCATDWNGDGLLDLLVGDVSYQKPKPRKLNPEEQAELDSAKQRLEKIQSEQSEIYSRLGTPFSEKKEKDPKVIEELSKRLSELHEEAAGLRKIIPQTQTHGWIWLFLQKKEG